jgi:hypothetical protein
MEQTTATCWEAIKMLRSMPFEALSTDFARTLCNITCKVPLKEVIELQCYHVPWIDR